MCAGQPAGCEAATHAMNDIFEEEETDAILLVDGSNSFNSLSRAVMLHNIKYLCPSMAAYIRNCYSTPSRLFVAGTEILSSEGTTQGDPLAMPVYAIGITPLLSLINATGYTLETEHKVKHAAFADDLGGTGKLQQIREWWDKIVKFGPLLGYYPNASKSWLIMKYNQETEAKHIFNDVTIEGRKYLEVFKIH